MTNDSNDQEMNAWAVAQAMSRTAMHREAVCELCEHAVVIALHVPLEQLRARTRCVADVALARQIAMYLARTVFNLLEAEVGLHFKRDRTTVGHACRLVEDKRDDPVFDCTLEQLEALLEGARTALGATAHAARQMQLNPSNATRTHAR